MSQLLNQVRDNIRIRNYSYRTEKTYIDWIKRFVNQAFKNGECSHIKT